MCFSLCASSVLSPQRWLRQIGHWSLERAMDRIASAKRRRASPDEDWLQEQEAAAEAAKTVVHQACACSPWLVARSMHVVAMEAPSYLIMPMNGSCSASAAWLLSCM